MGLLDKIKHQATEVASTVAEKTQETAKVGQFQIQLRNLKGDEKDALATLGERLMDVGEIPGELGPAADRVKEIRAKIAEKEAEIAQVRGEEGSSASGQTVESTAEEVVDASAPAQTDGEPAA